MSDDVIAELNQEIARLRQALRNISRGAPRPVAKSYFVDGRPSDHDMCPHNLYHYELCDSCIDTYIAQILGEEI